MFQGETAITIDDKGRLAIPTAYRDLVARASGNRLVVTYNPFDAGCLYLYPHEDFRFANDQGAFPATAVRLEPSSDDACVHVWYSRQWDTPDHRERYVRALRWLEAGRPATTAS